VHGGNPVGHQSHFPYQRKELLEVDACGACNAMGQPIALNTTHLWDVSGVEGEKEQVQGWLWVQQTGLEQ